jgi:CubicO group peptidase (beta-lactamase class C family)
VKTIRVRSNIVTAVVFASMLAAVHTRATAQETPAKSAPTAGIESVTVNTPRATTAGNTFTLPAGWQIRTDAAKVVLEPPEPDAHLALVDVEAKDADDAVKQAWAAYQPEAKRPLRLATQQAARNGWEERRDYDYETSPDEKLSVYVVARRKGPGWTVSITDTSLATLEKRRSQFSLALASLRPKGYQRETFAGKTPHPLTPERIEVMKAFVADGMRQLGIPGVGFSLIDGGKVVYEGGLGVKELGKPDKVDADTLFIAASNTKAMTTLLMAKLVDEHKLRWDEPVVEAYPGFRLGDDDTTRRVLVKHLVCACTGMPRQDLEWLLQFGKSTADSSVKLLAGMHPTSGFGDLFQYSNLMVASAGYVAAALEYPGMELGAAYDKAMQNEVFRPLGMKNTTFDFKRALSRNHASPHGDDADGNVEISRQDPNYSAVPIRPAAGMWTSARDLSKYVEMELAGGKLPNGVQLVSAENLLARRSPQVMIGEDADYGMALAIDTSWGIPMIHHGGDMFGYHSDMMWLPGQGVGAVILTNGEYGWALRGAVLRRLAEILFDGKPEAADRLRASADERVADMKVTRKRLVIPADKSKADKLARRYSNPALGRVVVNRGPHGVIFDFGDLRSKVASRINDDGTISFITIDPTINGFEFVVGQQAATRTLTIRDAQHEYVFAEVPGGK